MTTAPGPTVLDAASLLCEVADELVVKTVRDTHTAWVDRIHGVGRLATGAVYLLLGVVIISSLSGVGRTAVRYQRRQAYRERDDYRRDGYRDDYGYGYEQETRRYR